MKIDHRGFVLRGLFCDFYFYNPFVKQRENDIGRVYPLFVRGFGFLFSSNESIVNRAATCLGTISFLRKGLNCA